MEFKDLTVWQLSKELSLDIYTSLKNCKDFWFKDQIQRATISIMNNIAEWFERWTLKDKQKFYIISKWSAWEVRSMLFIATDLWYVTKESCDELIDKTYSISKMLQWLIIKSKF